MFRQQPHDGERGYALAAAGFTDQAQRLAGEQVEADAVDGIDRVVLGAEPDDQVANAEERLAGGAGSWRRRGRGGSHGRAVGRHLGDHRVSDARSRADPARPAGRRR